MHYVTQEQVDKDINPLIDPVRANMSAALIHETHAVSTIWSGHSYTALQIQKAVTAHLKSEQLLPFGFVRQHTNLINT